MYICNCNAVTESEIRGAISLGSSTIEDLRRDLGVGDCCGKCVPEARDILRECAAAGVRSPVPAAPAAGARRG